MNYYFSKTLETSFDEAIQKTIDVLKVEGFGVNSEINIHEKLKEKLNVDFRRYKILGACNLPYAYKALQAEDKIGTMLPCNVIVQEPSENRIEVAAVNPITSMMAIQNPDLAGIAQEVTTKLQSVIKRPCRVKFYMNRTEKIIPDFIYRNDMKKIFNYIKIAILISCLAVVNTYAQETSKVIGTIGNEKPGKDKIVICVFGIKACMPVKIDTSMTVKYQGRDTKLIDLPFGLYLEAAIADDKAGGKIIQNLSIDETKTAICFTDLKKEQESKLNDVLSKTKGVNSFKIHCESSQVYIEYNPKTIAYKGLENTIKKEGFELE